jgi:excinuclease ABC subunit A
MVVIEHNLEVVKTADWIVDMGPEGGDGGGEVVAAGTPEQIARNARSHTGAYLRAALARRPAKRGRAAAE